MTVEDGAFRIELILTAQCRPGPLLLGASISPPTNSPDTGLNALGGRTLQSFQLIADAFQGYPVVPDVLKGLGADLRKAGLGEAVL